MVAPRPLLNGEGGQCYAIRTFAVAWRTTGSTISNFKSLIKNGRGANCEHAEEPPDLLFSEHVGKATALVGNDDGNLHEGRMQAALTANAVHDGK